MLRAGLAYADAPDADVTVPICRMTILRASVNRLRAHVRANPRIWAVLAVAFVLRVAWLLYARPEPISDFNDYRTLARDMLDHGQFGYPEPTSFFLPGHPTFLAFLMLFSRSALWLGFGMVALSTAACGLLYLVARRIFDDGLRPLLAAGACAVSPSFIFFSPVLATEHLFVVFMLLALLMALRLGDRPVVSAVAAGAFLGLAVLTRGESLFYVPAVLAVLWFGRVVADRGRKLLLAGLVLVATVAVILPWNIRNQVVVGGGTGLSASGGINFYTAHNDSGFYGVPPTSPLDGLDAVAANSLGWELGLEYVREHPLSLVRNVRPGTTALFRDPDYALFWSTHLPKGPSDQTPPLKELRFLGVSGNALRLGATAFLVLSAASLIAWRSWPRRLWLVVPPVVFGSWFGRTVLYWAKPRYRYFMDVILTLLVALVVAKLFERRPGAFPPAAAGRADPSDPP